MNRLEVLLLQFMGVIWCLTTLQAGAVCVDLDQWNPDEASNRMFDLCLDDVKPIKVYIELSPPLSASKRHIIQAVMQTWSDVFKKEAPNGVFTQVHNIDEAEIKILWAPSRPENNLGKVLFKPYWAEITLYDSDASSEQVHDYLLYSFGKVLGLGVSADYRDVMNVNRKLHSLPNLPKQLSQNDVAAIRKLYSPNSSPHEDLYAGIPERALPYEWIKEKKQELPEISPSSSTLAQAPKPGVSLDKAPNPYVSLRPGEGDYFLSLAQSWGRWLKPVKLYIQPEPTLLPEDNAAFYRALEKWQSYFPIEQVTDKTQANMTVRWVPVISNSVHELLGVAITSVSPVTHEIIKADIELLHPNQYKKIPRRILEQVSLHEFAHALGILGHSNNKLDLMYPFARSRPEGQVKKALLGSLFKNAILIPLGGVSIPNPLIFIPFKENSSLTVRDINTLVRIYQQPLRQP